LFGTIEELSLGSTCGSAHIEAMSILYPKFLALHGKLVKYNFVFCEIKLPVSLELAKHKY